MLLEKLKPFIEKYNEINEKLASPEITKDIKQMTKLSREARSLEEIVNKAKEYEENLNALEEAKEMLNLGGEFKEDQRVVVALEKKHSDEIVVTYYIQTGRKALWLYSIEDGKVVKEKKDPYGITVTEVFHTNKQMDSSYKLNIENIKVIKKLLKDRFIVKS